MKRSPLWTPSQLFDNASNIDEHRGVSTQFNACRISDAYCSSTTGWKHCWFFVGARIDTICIERNDLDIKRIDSEESGPETRKIRVMCNRLSGSLSNRNPYNSQKKAS